jgi:predicted DsbA family dithiol-disulfide isomerase
MEPKGGWAEIQAMSMTLTYYTEVVSSWCYWAEPAWAELKERYQGRIDFDWRIALMDVTGLPVTRSQCEWFYRRSGTIVRSPVPLNSGWFEEGVTEYLAPNLVAEAARDLGVSDDRARLAISRAAMQDGLKVGRLEVSAAVVAAATGLDADLLMAHARTEPVLKRLRETTSMFHALGVNQRPTFVLESSIGDRAVFSGVWKPAPLVAAIESMLEDEAAYASWSAHFGGPPPG